jgi:peptidoglycan/LPS O-acetylase OafA/YrhL
MLTTAFTWTKERIFAKDRPETWFTAVARRRRARNILRDMRSGTAVSSHDRIEQFDGLRALAFLAVFCRHMLHVWFGQLGVDMFFVLSGFLITRNLLAMRDTPPGNACKIFFYRRALRIIPPYYLALMVMIAAGFLPVAQSHWYFGFVSNIRDSM